MSKKSRQREQMLRAQAASASAQPGTGQATRAPVGELEAAAAKEGVTLTTVGGASSPERGSVEPTETEGAIRTRLQALIDAYRRGVKTCEDRELKILVQEETSDKRSAELDALHTKLEAERGELEKDKRAVAAARVEVDARVASTIEREEKIAAREADADAGFVARREEMLRELERAHKGLLDRNQKLHEEASAREQDHLARLLQQQGEHERRLEEMRREAEVAIHAREAAIKDAESKLRDRERELERALFDAREAARDAEDMKAHVEEYIEDRAADRVASVTRQVETAVKQREDLKSRIEELERTLAAREAAVRVLENMSPEAVKTRIEALARRVAELENDLADRPSRAEADELRELREDRARWEHERGALSVEKGRLESQLSRLMIEVDRAETLRDRNTALKETQRLLKGALDDLRKDIDERLEKHRDQPTYPEMLRMDEDAELGKAPVRLFPGSDDIDLRQFAADLRHRIGLDVDGERPKLYYREEDIRAFLGGLAMSRLHIIQGISGIGKSSLPRAFADAVGGFCETISVQAGWRDRNDIFGYFNAFERRFYELPFAQALYRAGAPQWRDRIAIVLLDEMNLSHPEQYAADVLDVLERQDGAERRFELLSFTPPGKAPGRLEGGRFLPLPRNVWFVGTANHDETTKDFADKTYDRSFVLELPGRPTAFPLEKQDRRAPVSYDALVDAFDRAANDHAKVASEAILWMQQHLREPMDQRFRVGWGGRLDSQVRRFVPVVCSAGGGLGEALDQIVATRVLRKIKGRHDNIEEDLEHVIGVLDKTWPDRSRGPVASRLLLTEELRHLKG